MWIVDVPGKKPDGGHPPWQRFRRLKGEISEGDVLEYLKQLVQIHGCVRAVQGGVEVSLYGKRLTIVRYL